MSQKTVSDSDLIARANTAPDVAFGMGTAALVRDLANELLLQRKLERVVREAALDWLAADNALAELDRWRGGR